MNLRFEVVEDHDEIAKVTARIQTAGVELRDEVRGLLVEAIERGRMVAEREAPRGLGFQHESGRISDSIQVSERRYSPGGAGGGGFYEMDLYASSEIAPHLRFVMEGTMDEGEGLIKPSRGNVLVIDKGGEGVRFRRWAHGQRANTQWWENAQDEVNITLEDGIQEL